MANDALLPCPALTVRIHLPPEAADVEFLKQLPSSPGVFLIEDESGEAIGLACAANLRRRVAAKLKPRGVPGTASKAPELRSLARTVSATPVASAFEADWAYLQIARLRLPATYRGLLDRWQAWFVHVDPQAEFPLWSKTAHPSLERTGSFLGPMPDKHAAARYIEMLQDAFDLCRYHHLLVQAPHAAACMYKEMGRCSAPCDGTVSMASYRQRIEQSLAFGRTNYGAWRGEEERAMHVASDSLAFEAAQQHRQMLDRTSIAARSEFAHVDRLERFAFCAVMPSERDDHARLFALRGGWIAPLADVPLDAGDATINDIIRALHSLQVRDELAFGEAGVENIAMACRHLFRPRGGEAQGAFLRVEESLNPAAIRAALGKLARAHSSGDSQPAVADQDFDAVNA